MDITEINNLLVDFSDELELIASELENFVRINVKSISFDEIDSIRSKTEELNLNNSKIFNMNE